MTEHNFDFDDAMSVEEFFKTNGVKKGNKSFIVKTCHPEDEDADAFLAVGFYNGENLKDGRKSYDFFVPSRALRDNYPDAFESEAEFKAFLKSHKEELQLLEPVDGLKFGICFLSGGADDWDDL